MTYEEAMRLVTAARPRTVETAGLKVGEWSRLGRVELAPIGHNMMMMFAGLDNFAVVEIQSITRIVVLRSLYGPETPRDVAVNHALTEWQRDYPTLSIEPDWDGLRRHVFEVAEALAAEVDRLRAFRAAVASAAGLAEEIGDKALIYGAVERPLSVLRKVARTADLTDVPILVAPWAPENPPQPCIPEMEHLREENEVSIGAAQYLAALIVDPDGGLADAVWRALGDGARERVETLLKAARDAVGGAR